MTVLDTRNWSDNVGVIFLASADHELARERQYGRTIHGTFTRVLLAELASDGSYSKTYTQIYENVLRYMPKSGDRILQTPTLLGDRVDSKLWYASADSGWHREEGMSTSRHALLGSQQRTQDDVTPNVRTVSPVYDFVTSRYRCAQAEASRDSQDDVHSTVESP